MVILDFIINFIANAMTIVTAGLAIYIFITNKDKIKTAFNFILNYSNQITLSDLKYKIEKINDFRTTIPEQKEEVINLLHDIEGHILGNKFLKDKLPDQLKKINNFTRNPAKLEEPQKRSLVSELKECVRNLDVSNFGDTISQ
ncbi:hypothetical protein SAMN06265349_101710 [Flavobacterium resistens]|uniref:Uncharacterized protein n=1 Tax=Flavobacterium resistens TaxID=443612 RepID=A0A521B5N7_9FLAO|nr:hypothetical protein [Flavobacterium resistens]MRX70288.1 hypothetical protein [Flavobacterium resistens]SMO42399.1 hypothetical protein SAMN06265349_101710 [Flavobacterium resistens]